MKSLLPLETVISGEIQGGETRKQLPDIPVSMVKIKALSDNAGSVYIGGSEVTVPNGVTDENAGYELDANDVLDWIPITNLNQLWMITDNNGDDIVYIAFRKAS